MRAPASGGAGKSILACAITFLALGSMTSALGAGIPGIAVLFRVPRVDAGMAVSAYNLGALTSMAALCLLRRGAQPRTRIFLGCAVLGCCGMSWYREWNAFLACAVLAGAGYGALVVIINSHIAHRFAGHRGSALNIVNAAFGAGAVIGPLLVRLGIQRDLLACAVILAACTTTAAVGGEAERAPRNEKQDRGAEASDLARFALVGFLYAGLEGGLASWGSSDLAALGYPAGAAAQLIALFWCGLTFGRLAIPVLGRHLSSITIFCACVCATGMVMPLAMIGGFAPAVFGLAGLMIGPVWPSFIALATERASSGRRVTACVAMAETGGNICMPLIIGMSLACFSPFYLPVVIAAVAASTMAATALSPAGRRPGRAHIAIPGRAQPTDERPATSASRRGARPWRSPGTGTAVRTTSTREPVRDDERANEHLSPA